MYPRGCRRFLEEVSAGASSRDGQAAQDTSSQQQQQDATVKQFDNRISVLASLISVSVPLFVYTCFSCFRVK